ncbi:hypothetical protein E2C01_027028 [Portunus trituberculatus]|uniref:Uncharacterized protein n=1 Tax=Portunus trituberculatus TaxID=210409 RepID=A0A5B7EGU9_PORTR|nr:hypothetical protein [Portunus trituberculatus]
MPITSHNPGYTHSPPPLTTATRAPGSFTTATAEFLGLVTTTESHTVPTTEVLTTQHSLASSESIVVYKCDAC